jgi:3-oxoacyl-[acyl-carrier-protein] synthase II
MREVWITGVGVVSAHGLGSHALASAIRDGRRSLTKLDFPTEGFPIREGGLADALDPEEFVTKRKDLKLMSRDARLAVAAGVLALRDAGLEGEAGDDLGLFMGVGPEKGDVSDLVPAVAASREGGRLSIPAFAARGMELMNPLASLKTLPNMPLAHVSIRLGAMGPNLALSPDERATELAMEEAEAAVAHGECDRALAGGADCLTSLSGFCLAWRHGRLGPGRPPGEGAALLLLEAAEVARARGARPYRAEDLPGPLAPWIGFSGAAHPAICRAAELALGGRA